MIDEKVMMIFLKSDSTMTSSGESTTAISTDTSKALNWN